MQVVIGESFLLQIHLIVPATQTVSSGAMTPTCEESQGGERREP